MGSAEDAAAQRRARAEARKRRVLSGGTDRLAAVTRLRAEIEHEVPELGSLGLPTIDQIAAKLKAAEGAAGDAAGDETGPGAVGEGAEGAAAATAAEVALKDVATTSDAAGLEGADAAAAVSAAGAAPSTAPPEPVALFSRVAGEDRPGPQRRRGTLGASEKWLASALSEEGDDWKRQVLGDAAVELAAEASGGDTDRAGGAPPSAGAGRPAPSGASAGLAVPLPRRVELATASTGAPRAAVALALGLYAGLGLPWPPLGGVPGLPGSPLGAALAVSVALLAVAVGSNGVERRAEDAERDAGRAGAPAALTSSLAASLLQAIPGGRWLKALRVLPSLLGDAALCVVAMVVAATWSRGVKDVGGYLADQ